MNVKKNHNIAFCALHLYYTWCRNKERIRCGRQLNQLIHNEKLWLKEKYVALHVLFAHFKVPLQPLPVSHLTTVTYKTDWLQTVFSLITHIKICSILNMLYYWIIKWKKFSLFHHLENGKLPLHSTQKLHILWTGMFLKTKDCEGGVLTN